MIKLPRIYSHNHAYIFTIEFESINNSVVGIMDRRIFNIIMLPIAIACTLEILSMADNIYETTCRSALVQTYSPSNDCFIYVNGHIEKPGVYKLSADSQVIDAILFQEECPKN